MISGVLNDPEQIWHQQLVLQWGFSLIQSRGQRRPRLSWRGKSPNKELICLFVSVTLYSTLGCEKNSFCDRKQQNNAC